MCTFSLINTSFLSLISTTSAKPGGEVVKHPMQEMPETWVQSLGLEDPLEKEMATCSSILAWRIHRQRSLVGRVHGVAKSQTQLSD